MTISVKLLSLLVCPEDKSPVHLADEALIGRLNSLISKGELKNRAGVAVETKIDAGLVRADGRFLYPIREDIPVMLIDEAIPLES